MMRRHLWYGQWLCGVAVWGVILAAGAVAMGQEYDPSDFDVYKYSQDLASDVPGLYAVPDVDLATHGHGGQAYEWLATAANLLGGAGYGSSLGNTPQARADQIYLQLVADLGQVNTQEVHRAVNYWLLTYGRNPGSAEFQPDNAYTDVTRVQNAGGLQMPDYHFLLDELDRCQYVAVHWYVTGDTWGTLVGGDYGGNGSQSIWHDADRDSADVVYTVDDDVYTNDFTLGRWDLDGRPNRTWANEYVTLCPGLAKPTEAMENYDAAYLMRDDDRDGVWEAGFRVAGDKAGVFGTPMWTSGRKVKIFNEFEPEKWKEVYLLVDYNDRVPGRDLLETITLEDDKANEYNPTSVVASADDGQLLFTWILPDQPAWEIIIFPDNRYKSLDDDVKDWNVATICVPEPMTLMLLVAGAAAIVRRRRARA